MGRTAPEVRDPAVREIIHGHYRIVSELLNEPNAVYVLRFRQTARGKPEVPKR